MFPNRRAALSVPSALAALLPAQSPQTTVVPASYATTDAVSHLWVAGASRDVRQQTLVGPSHLGALVGRTLTAIELRRSATNETYQGGTASLTVTLSTSPNVPLTCSQTFAANVGNDAAQVFAGNVTLPHSPPATGPAVGWTTANTVRIAFTTPFAYQGGTLCIDVVGHPVAGQNANWWMADAEFEDLAGTTAEIGTGCGSFGGPHGRWSFVSARTLLPGGYARFWAEGPPNSIGIAAFGAPGALPIPLTAFGLPAPAGCNLWLGSLDTMMVAVFEPEVHPLALGRASAEVRIRIPNNASVFGVTLATQWLEWSQLAVSNAIRWTVAGAIPTLDMAAIEGHPMESRGEVAVHMAHVLRLEHQ
ncbi:MAG: hypothetical protein WAT39_21525 [Planctomycetota bacterium]